MHILIVDDEPLARMRLRTLLGDCADAGASPLEVAEAQHAQEAVTCVREAALRGQPFQLVLLDIHMPGADGLQLAQALHAQPQAPAVVFVTAHAEHAVAAFEIDAVDYLTKPVRLERLQQALAKARRKAPAPAAAAEHLVIHDRGRTERVPLAEVVYFKAELKYVTVRTAARSYILDGSLSELESRYGPRFLRIHRNALVARHAMRALEKHYDAEDGEGWAVRLLGVAEPVPVSRRQVQAVREALSR
ncbi:LytTR family DNA-binding domain-containing protein [Ramlibacter sp. H39-3-26]|uniref:LytR/AlgR family response regulator transcription factor n=1 Tax=Curvibacter soli TaxID=3031331 RepID=UPI0023DB56B6|nr:LytTR family DNA-binding domain-containing protein [Ramlibacter sp. H39-3-26]MDF1485398.1 LytTR family DNA-binding domain-containing protein [Ramlibacter sp. H39-3-26]